MVSRNRILTRSSDGKAINGVRELLTGLPSMTLGQRAYSATTLVAAIQRRIDACDQVERLRQQWIEAAESYDALDRETDVLMTDLRNLVVMLWGQDPNKHAAFGFTPRKKPELTVEQRAASRAKALATRKARGTKGRKQRLAIKGEVVAAGTSPAPETVKS